MAQNQQPDKFSSLIRTMKNDLEAVSKGMDPSGALVEKTIESPSSPLSSKELVPQDLPVPPAPKFGQNSPNVELGELKKSKFLTSPSFFPPPPPPSLKFSPSKNISVSEDISVPAEGKSFFSGRNLIILAVILIVAGAAIWLLIRDDQKSIVIESPTPTPFVTETPSAGEFILSSSLDPYSSLFLFLNGLKINPQEFKIFKVLDDNRNELTFFDFSSKFLLDFPEIIIQSLGDLGRTRLLVYGQTEKLSQFPPTLSYGIIVKADNSVGRQEVSSSSADGLTVDLKNSEDAVLPGILKMLDLNTADSVSNTFLDNNYNGQSIRYRNFPLPDRTIDYAVISDAGATYLVMVNSRELIFSIIDNFTNIVVDSGF